MDHATVPLIASDSHVDASMCHVNPSGVTIAEGFGLNPRNYKTHPVGYLEAAKPFDLPLIPRSEWKDRLAALKAAKAQLTDIRDRGMFGQPMPSRDQDGYGYCVTEDTEVLTEKGWVAYPQYDWSTPLGTVNQVTHALEFQVPFERHVYEYDGEIIGSTNRRIDFAVTPDHQMYVRKWDESRRTLSDRYSFVRAGDLGWYCGLLSAPAGWIGTELIELGVEGDRDYDGDDLLALLALVASDGYAGGSESTKNWVSFCCFYEPWRARVDALARRLGFTEKPSQRGVWVRYDAAHLARWIRETCYQPGMPRKAPFKKIPDLVKVASARQIKHFLSWFGDQNKTGATVFYSSSRAIIDGLQDLCLRIGKRGTIAEVEGREAVYAETGQVIRSGKSYRMTVGDVDRLCLDRKKHIETDHYKGLVYCAAVPNHTLITRRNGSVLISSNCWAHSSTSACLLQRAVQGQPYADLSAFMVACIIKNYRNRGGWGAESLEFIAENGIATSNTWPQQKVDRSLDNATMRAEAANYKVTEWMDMEPRNVDQLVTCLLLNIPVVSDFNWWGHSVCSADLVDIDPNNPAKSIQTIIWNSWGDSWSQNGMGKLQGRKAIPDGMICPRVVMSAVA